jgi:hypothetical protein
MYWIEFNLLNYLIEILSFFFVFYKLSLTLQFFFSHRKLLSHNFKNFNSSRFRPCLTLGGNALNILSSLSQIMFCVFVFWYRGSLKSSACNFATCLLDSTIWLYFCKLLLNSASWLLNSASWPLDSTLLPLDNC